MYVEIVPAESFGKTHFSQRLARPGPDHPQRAERWAEIDPDARLGAVKRRHVLGRQTGLQAFQIHLLRGLPGAGIRWHATFRVQRPILLGLSFAEYSNEARGRLPRSLEQNLHFPAPAFIVIRTLLREDQRIVQLHFLDDHRSASLGGGCRYRHCPIERARGYDTAEHPVIVQPSRV